MNSEQLIDIKPRLISPGDSNALYKHCFAITYFQGKQLIAYGSSNNVVITSNTFTIVDELKGDRHDAVVTAVAWATYSGRLSSFETNQNDYQRIVIWEPKRSSGHWEKLQVIKVDIEIICLSWSKGDNILCTASKQNFQIHVREENKKRNHQNPTDQNSEDNKNNNILKCVYTNNVPTEFCSHSRDSRFILTLPVRPDKKKVNNDKKVSMKGVLIYYKRGKSDNDYKNVLIKHPAPVISARWRTSDQSHGNCCFMTVSEDRVVRIWYETSVNENFKFSVVASLPSTRNILVASFISTSSKYISNSPLFEGDNDENESERADDSNDTFTYLSKQYKDAYAYGNGHLVKRDGNYRETYVNDKNGDSQNFFYFLTFDKNQYLAIWKVTGLSSNIRTTPKISQLLTKDIRLGIEPNAVNNIYAFCRLSSEFSLNSSGKNVAQPMSLSLILQNNLIGSLTSLDLSINSASLYLTNFISIHGHQSDIKSIRINKDYPFMVTLGEKHNRNDKSHNYNFPFIWKFNDTDVYDPSILSNFFYQLDVELEAVDWLYSNSKLIGYSDQKFKIIKLIRSNAPVADLKPTDINFQFKNLLNSNVKDFRVLCGNEENGVHNYILSILFEHDFYLLHLNDMKISELLHLQEENDEFVDLCDSYISQLFHDAGALLCLIASKHKAYSIFLNKDILKVSSNSDSKTLKTAGPASTPPKSKPFSLLIPSAKKEEAQQTPKKTVEVAAYSTIFDTTNQEEEIRSLCYIHPAYYVIACDHTIYFCRRYSCSLNDVREFQKISVDYIPLQIRCNPHGMISIVSEKKIELYHQIRSTSEFGKSNLHWEKFAQQETNSSSVVEWSLDGFLIYASNENIYSLTKYMDTYFYDESRMFATVHNSMASHSLSIQDMNVAILIPLAISGRTDLVLNMLDYLDQYYDNRRINIFYQNYVLNYNEESKKPFEKDVDALLDSLYTKAKMNSIITFSERENEEFIRFILNLKKLLQIQPESLDQRSIPAARAIALDETHSIPFDLINLAYISHDQVKLLDCVNFQNWESILNSGVFFWMKDLKFLIDKLVPFAISNFSTRRDVAIIILSMTHKFVVLKQLFKKAGDEARASFFGRNFNLPKEKKSAEKNGYSALSKHDFYTAAAMFVLSGNITVAIRILMQNTPDVALAYLLCRYTEDNYQSLNKIIDEFLEPRAKEANDDAAIDFFKKQKNPDYQYSLDERIRNEKAGNLVPTSNYFYDMRFVSCEVLTTTIEQKADLCLCFLLSGANFLNTIYLNHLGKYVFHKDEGPKETIHESQSTNFDFKFQTFTDESDNDTDETTEEISDEITVKEIDAFSFGGVMGTSYTSSFGDDFSYSDDDFDSDSESSSKETKPQANSGLSAQTSNRRFSVIKSITPNAKKPSLLQPQQQQQTNLPRLQPNPNLNDSSIPKMPPLLSNNNNNNNPKVHFPSSASNESFSSGGGGDNQLSPFPKANNITSPSNSLDKLPSGEDTKEPFMGQSQPLRLKTSFAPQTRDSSQQSPPANHIRRTSRIFSSNISTLMNPSMSNLANKYENYLIDENKTRQPILIKPNIHQSSSTTKLYTEVHSDGSDFSDDDINMNSKAQTFDLSVSGGVQQLQSQANWLLDIVVFNISRLRLEQFMNTQFSNEDNLISLIHTKIREASGNISQMMTHFNNYLIRSCKRRGIISRRLLLISNEKKQQFIQDVCHCITLLPDQLIATKLTKQQIAQICRTTQVLIDIINRNLIDGLDKSTMFLSVSAAILTSIYIIALYKHDVKIMNKLLHIDLTQSNPKDFVKTIKSFLGLDEDNSIKEFLKVSFIQPGKYPPNLKVNRWGKNYISFLSNDMKKNFINSKKSLNLTQYASSLIDFLIIDTLIKKIQDLKSNPLVQKAKKGFFKDNFNLLLLNFKKSYDIITQKFTYSTINFPSFIEFDSLSEICENFDDNLNEFTNYLFSLNNRSQSISKYSMNIIQKFSLNSNSNLSSIYSSLKLSSTNSSRNVPHKLSRIGSQNESNISTYDFSQINDNINSTHKILSLTKIASNFQLEDLRSIMNCNSSVYSICLDGDRSSIFIATDNGVKSNSLSKLRERNIELNSSEESKESNEGIFLHFNNNTEDLSNEFQENENENENEKENEPKIEEEEEDTTEKAQNLNSADNLKADSIDSISQASSSMELPTDQPSTSQSGKSKKSKEKKKSMTAAPSKQPKSAAPAVKAKIQLMEETPTCALTSPSGNTFLVGYKNGKVDLFILKDPSQQLTNSSTELSDKSGEPSEVSRTDSEQSLKEKRKERRNSEKNDKSESTDSSDKKKKKRRRRSSDKGEKSDMSESTENTKDDEKRRKKKRSADKEDKSESTESKSITDAEKARKSKSSTKSESN